MVFTLFLLSSLILNATVCIIKSFLLQELTLSVDADFKYDWTSDGRLLGLDEYHKL